MEHSAAPREPYLRLFLRFLRFGVLAWGGPVAQIAMIRQELVEDEKWITSARFNRVLAVYQVLPGPEAHELCVYFGMIARGRIGAVLSGLGFMLPGFLLMLALSWFYVAVGVNSPFLTAVFLGCQPAVAALILRATHRIGAHALHRGPWLWTIALTSGVATLLGVNFLATLGLAGILYALVRQRRMWLASCVSVACLAALVAVVVDRFSGRTAATAALVTVVMDVDSAPSLAALFGYGLRAGLLTFGGAYTAIPFLQHDAVEVGRWLSNAQFLDGLALSGLLPAPLIIFATFVGYLGGSLAGALALTAGVFLPAFAFTLLGHDYLERLVENKATHAFLDGVTAGVVGLIGATAAGFLRGTISSIPAGVVFLLALFALYRWKAKWLVAIVVISAGAMGGFWFR